MNQTTCPNCGHKFDAGEALQKHLEIELGKKIAEQQKAKEQEIEAYKRQLAEEKKKFIAEERQSMWSKAQAEGLKQANEKNAAELQALKEENERRKQQILESQQKELELLRREGELKNQQDQLKIELEKELLLKRQEIEEIARKKEEERFELIKKEYEKRLEDQVKLVDEMKRKAEQGSMQMQGEVQELALEELLQSAFPYDEIQEVSKGIRGADVIQVVRNELGQECGKIIYESKRTQNFGGDWIEKLKDDQRTVGADIAVLVTQTMPKDMERFGEKEGVWVCNFIEMKALVYALRKILIQTQTAKSSQENRADKMAVMYSYLTSTQFRQQIEAIVDGFKTLKEDLEREKRAYQKIWREREAAIEKVLGSTIDLYGSVRGIAGKALERIQYLELPGADDEEN
jgi:hypothetical protein